jgi:hypothetical protein
MGKSLTLCTQTGPEYVEAFVKELMDGIATSATAKMTLLLSDLV